MAGRGHAVDEEAQAVGLSDHRLAVQHQKAARLADTASTRREALSHSQEHIDARREHADKIDPRKDAGRDDNGQKDGLNVDEPGRHTLRDGRADTMRPDVRTQ